MEVMGLMLGQFVDDSTINCVDVFAMPQSGTGVSAERPRLPDEDIEMLKQTGRPEIVVGWYHSHPGFVLARASTSTRSRASRRSTRAVASPSTPCRASRARS